MGTTVTTNLALIKPDISESIKAIGPSVGWAAQNASNCDKLDGLFRHSSHTWSPAWTTDSVNPTLGSGGLVEGKYIRLFPSLALVYFRIFTGGAGFNPGSGFYRLDLPFTLHAPLLTMNIAIPIGKAYLHDNDAVATSTNLVVMYETTMNLISFRKHDGNFWRDNAPFTLAQNDRCNGYFMLPTTSA